TLSSLFAAVYRPPRALPPFPTRRSSDLIVRRPAGELVIARAAGERVGFGPAAERIVPAVARERVRVASAAEHVGSDSDTLAGDRSEEHTSELQSRRDLVCRLLLEKKKKT